MVRGIESIDFSTKIKKTELLIILKKEASDISIMDIMNACKNFVFVASQSKIVKACNFLIEDAKYVQSSYKKEYLKSYNEAFITRLKVLKDNKENYDDPVDCDELKEAVDLLNEQESQIEAGEGFDPHFFKIYKIMSIYTTFILEEAVHPPGTPFPGG